MSRSEIAELERDLKLMEDAGHDKIPISIAAVRKMIAAISEPRRQR